MLTVDPKKRITAKDVLSHEWMKNQIKTNIDTNQLKKYNAARKLKKAAQKLMKLQKAGLMLPSKN